jgi:hypothetical protein
MSYTFVNPVVHSTRNGTNIAKPSESAKPQNSPKVLSCFFAGFPVFYTTSSQDIIIQMRQPAGPSTYVNFAPMTTGGFIHGINTPPQRGFTASAASSSQLSQHRAPTQATHHHPSVLQQEQEQKTQHVPIGKFPTEVSSQPSSTMEVYSKCPRRFARHPVCYCANDDWMDPVSLCYTECADAYRLIGAENF